MSDAIFDVILTAGAMAIVGFGVVMLVVPRIEARERKRAAESHAAE